MDKGGAKAERVYPGQRGVRSPSEAAHSSPTLTNLNHGTPIIHQNRGSLKTTWMLTGKSDGLMTTDLWVKNGSF